MNNSLEDKITVGVVELGQSPRPDVMSTFKEILGSNVKINDCGSLDGLSQGEIKRFAPSFGDKVVVTRLLDGMEVKLNKDKLIERMKQCITNLEDRSKVIIIFCTGSFPELSSKKLLIKPSLIISSIVQSLVPKGRLGVLIPTPEQIPQIESKWKSEGITTHIESLSAYKEQNVEKVKEIAMRYQKASVDLIILDCMGYNTQLSEHIKKLTAIPVILSQTLVASIVNELL